ncbi:MAG: hypothetical protein NXI25_01490 [bacterium]|nr:hypothetical protein [bacterium]
MGHFSCLNYNNGFSQQAYGVAASPSPLLSGSDAAKAPAAIYQADSLLY